MTRAFWATGALLLWVSACAPGDLRPPQVGDPAPEFQAVSLDGERTVTLADYAGQTILVNLWATWCAPCRFETPYHQSAFAADGRELRKPAGHQFVGIDLMTGVPDQTILVEIKDQVQRETQFHHAQVAGKVRGAILHNRAQCLAHLIRQLQKLLVAERLQLPWGGDHG